MTISKPLRRVLFVLASLAVALSALAAYATHGSIAHTPLRRFASPAAAGPMRVDDVLERGTRVAFCTLETGRVHVPRSMLLRRDATQHDEAHEHVPVPIFAHFVRHPARGDVLVDTGLDASFVDDPLGNLAPPARAVHGSFGARFELPRGSDIASQLARLGATPRIAFITHVHGDHTAGLPALPASMSVVVGTGDADDPSAYVGYGHVGARTVHELDASRAVAMPPFDRVIDVFGDRSLIAIATPGHSRGHTSFLVNAVSGPVLLVGDASHTAFAFSHGIGPNGPTEADERIGQRSLERLRTFVARHPEVRVVYGHEAPVRVCDPVVAR